MNERIVGQWLRTSSERGVLACRFDPDGRYRFYIVGKDVSECGQYRVVSRPSERSVSGEVNALLLHPDDGVQTAIVLAFQDDGLLLDGQRWQAAGHRAQLPGR